MLHSLVAFVQIFVRQPPIFAVIVHFLASIPHFVPLFACALRNSAHVLFEFRHSNRTIFGVVFDSNPQIHEHCRCAFSLLLPFHVVDHPTTSCCFTFDFLICHFLPSIVPILCPLR